MPKTCFDIRDAWKRPYLLQTGLGLIENTECALTRSDFDNLCIKYKVNNPLVK